MLLQSNRKCMCEDLYIIKRRADSPEDKDTEKGDAELILPNWLKM